MFLYNFYTILTDICIRTRINDTADAGISFKTNSSPRNRRTFVLIMYNFLDPRNEQLIQNVAQDSIQLQTFMNLGIPQNQGLFCLVQLFAARETPSTKESVVYYLRIWWTILYSLAFFTFSPRTCHKRRKLNIKELHNLYSSPTIIKMIKWRLHLARLEQMVSAYKVLIGKHGQDHLEDLGLDERITQEDLGRTNCLLSLILHGSHRKRRVQQLFYCCVCIRDRGNVFTEPLPSNYRGIHI
jgi:hypothetical protein